MTRRILMGAGALSVALALTLGQGASENILIAQGQGTVLPVFEVDPHFPKMPDGLVLGGVGGNAADSHGNVWVFHRPHMLEEGNAHENGYRPAPPVVMFDEKGNYVRGWGGPQRPGNSSGPIAADSSRNMPCVRRAPPRGGPTAMVVPEAANTGSSSITATTSG